MEKVDRVIDKIIRDLGLGQDLIPYTDFIEWIADALQHIGAYYQYQEKETGVVIQNYTGLLPCDLHKVIRITEGVSIDLSTSSGFYGGTLQGMLATLGVDFSELSPYEREILNSQGLDNISYKGYRAVVDRLQHNKNLIGNPVTNAFTNKDYNINLNRITTAYSEGVINIQYLALPIDERGFPLVPDDVSFRDALFWKVAYHLSMRNPSALPNQRMQDMEYCKQKWNFYCVQARAGANMPDLAMTERLANNWVRLFNTVDDGSEYYRKVGKPQMLDFNGRN
jgi:hypothetical protein